jgi:hypothetical protein
MFKKTIFTIAALIAVFVLALGTMAFTSPDFLNNAVLYGRGGPGGSGGRGTGIGVSATPLSAAEKDALNRAILEEYGALNLYQSAIAKLGNVYPFSYIVRAEQQHISALSNLAARYGVSVPANPGLAAQPAFSTLSEACTTGAAAEIADAALYDQLKPSVTHTDLLRVFSNLQSASLRNHLPAFQACD